MLKYEQEWEKVKAKLNSADKEGTHGNLLQKRWR